MNKKVEWRWRFVPSDKSVKRGPWNRKRPADNEIEAFPAMGWGVDIAVRVAPKGKTVT
jgi:hypothetical protein